MEGANIVPVMDMNRNNNYGDCWGGSVTLCRPVIS